MKRKIYIIVYILLCCYVSIHSQTIMKNSMRSIGDQYGVIVKSVSDTAIVYVTKTGQELTIQVPFNSVCYKGGITRLKHDIYQNGHVRIWRGPEPWV